VEPSKIGRAYLMAQLGNLGVDTIKNRASKVVGSDDVPMKRLSKGYAIKKTRLGKGNKRNLVLTGDMMDALSVRYATEDEVQDCDHHAARAAGGFGERSARAVVWLESAGRAKPYHPCTDSIWPSGRCGITTPRTAGERRPSYALADEGVNMAEPRRCRTRCGPAARKLK
jgi:hypothetical protein